MDKMIENAPISKVKDPPKAIPGIKDGSKTPSDMPTNAPSSAKRNKNTVARSDPTGTKRGSKKVKVKKAANIAEMKPENSL